MNWWKKVKLYFSEVWGEVKPQEGKVSWPGKEEVKGSTRVVIVTVAIVAVYLGAIDLVAGQLLAWMLGIR